MSMFSTIYRSDYPQTALIVYSNDKVHSTHMYSKNYQICSQLIKCANLCSQLIKCSNLCSHLIKCTDQNHSRDTHIFKETHTYMNTCTHSEALCCSTHKQTTITQCIPLYSMTHDARAQPHHDSFFMHMHMQQIAVVDWASIAAPCIPSSTCKMQDNTWGQLQAVKFHKLLPVNLAPQQLKLADTSTCCKTAATACDPACSQHAYPRR